MSVKSTIMAEFNRVAQEHDKSVVNLAEGTRLSDSGLDSLCFAIIVARLEDVLGVDPFTTSEDLAFPATVGEFISLYERAVP